jgi:hypothetical protein
MPSTRRSTANGGRSMLSAPDRAARKLAWLIREALRRELTGVGLTERRTPPPAARRANSFVLKLKASLTAIRKFFGPTVPVPIVALDRKEDAP